MAAHASLIDSRESEDLIADSPGDAIIARLDDPQIATSISLILDHADLIATIIVGLDELVRRAEVIGDNVASGLAEVRGLAAASSGTASWPAVDLGALSETVARLSAAVINAAPALDTLLRSPLTDPETAGVLADAGEALLEGKRAAATDPRGPKGVFALMRVTKDPDVSRGLGFMIHIARAFGRRLAPQDSPSV
ncbi:hypothetical protein A5784_05755 [Mycobacterium sp. 852013-50091_SCH5140682]|uniref:DUF1641 domain-containing protein n=1 Tax=Mycobacterium sp. 852013-50091_SCH5140682 TaxID=1834109 RepID=UPI0007EA8FAA|nr:DUF1641 domain-containing protein [Mycobacterium sp. 852013-50091_SCH5140682]OBC08900.1 hypothetical protein A5784_05755 [Mycobacterium sp. 852013-50091_SCH5140682]